MRGVGTLGTLLAILLAIAGVSLGVEAWLAGSLFRYVLAGIVAGAMLCVPLLSIVLLRERARRFWRRALFASIPLAAALLLVEFGMRLFGPAAVPPERLLEDERLGHVLAPGSGGSDAWGFRNERVPDRVDALFVGDSQTWGFFVEREQAFPAMFATITGLSAYQMANGAYGPVQYRELVRRGSKLRPRLVVVGFYFGNDLFDAAGSAGLASGEDLRADGRRYAKPRNPELDGLPTPNWTMAAADFVQRNSRLCGWAGEVVKSRLRGSASLLDAQPGAVPFVDDPVATVLLPEYRHSAVNLADPALNDAVRISQRCLHDIAADCRAANARCMLLGIPTKEYCYAQWLEERGTPMPELAALHAAEGEVRRRIFAQAETDGLEIVDLAPACIAALAEGTPIWAGNGDGHLMQNGHLTAARAIAETWSRR